MHNNTTLLLQVKLLYFLYAVCVNICYMAYITLQIPDCWEYFMLWPFAISPQHESWALFSWSSVPSQAPAKTQELKLWYLSHDPWKGGWKLDWKADATTSWATANTTKSSSSQGWEDIEMGCAPRDLSLLLLVAASTLFTPSGFFWSATINTDCKG